MTRAKLAGCLLFVAMLTLPASANSDHIYFESLKDLQPIGGHFSDFGITFSSNALVLTSSLAGGIGNFGNNSSGRNVVAFRTGTSMTMNVAGGFSRGFSFFYSAATQPGVVTIWSGENGTGTKIATINLAKNGSSSCGNGTAFCVWTPVGLTFDGVAKSVTFGGGAGQIAFDSFSMGREFPSAVPESSSALLVGIGLIALSCAGRFRKFLRARS